MIDPPMMLRAHSELPPINFDAYLLGTPGGNTGDELITASCEAYLQDRGIDVWRSDGSLESAAAEEDTEYLAAALQRFRGTIFFSGGGNIGIYPSNAALRSRIIAHLRPETRCLVFSQSVAQPESALLHERVSVWCRDIISFGIMRGAGARAALVPDAAFFMDRAFRKVPRGLGTFFIKRTPNGDAETLSHGITIECPSSDLTLQLSIASVIQVLEPFEIVISDRLHGGLVALMMRKKVVFLPVGYHKIEAFVATWLKGTGPAFARTQEELESALSNVCEPTLDFTELFRRHADPALDRFLLATD
jgi:exopolysaccharide biosynthesis predicted pyruvyltransferase EpsI